MKIYKNIKDLPLEVRDVAEQYYIDINEEPQDAIRTYNNYYYSNDKIALVRDYNDLEEYRNDLKDKIGCDYDNICFEGKKYKLTLDGAIKQLKFKNAKIKFEKDLIEEIN